MGFLDFFRRRNTAAEDKSEDTNVVDFPKTVAPPELKSVDQLAAEAEARKREEEDIHPVYQVGKTATGRVSMRLGNAHQYTTITMNNQGVDTLIRILEAAKEAEYEDEEDDGVQ
jgi:hypothetical protein